MLFGREAERAPLEQLLDAAAAGPVGCIVEGAPGIGKTAVWRESVDGARRPGYQVLEPLGARFWVSRTRDELARIGLRRARAIDGLTPAQSRVGELVAAGLTNPEIAHQLHMSVRTVESRLSRVYRQHGVSSRSQVVAALVSSGVAPAVGPSSDGAAP